MHNVLHIKFHIGKKRDLILYFQSYLGFWRTLERRAEQSNRFETFFDPILLG
jgi:hypothetical protein